MQLRQIHRSPDEILGAVFGKVDPGLVARESFEILLALKPSDGIANAACLVVTRIEPNSGLQQWRNRIDGIFAQENHADAHLLPFHLTGHCSGPLFLRPRRARRIGRPDEQADVALDKPIVNSGNEVLQLVDVDLAAERLEPVVLDRVGEPRHKLAVFCAVREEDLHPSLSWLGWSRLCHGSRRVAEIEKCILGKKLRFAGEIVLLWWKFWISAFHTSPLC